MSRRLFCCLVLFAACGLPRLVSAQALPWNHPHGYGTLEVPASEAAGPGDPRGATSYPHWGTPPQGGYALWPNDMVDGPVYGYGHPGHLGYPDSYGSPPGPGPYGPRGGGVGYVPPYSPQYQFYPQGGAPPGMPAPRTVYELLPEDRGILYDEDLAALNRFGERMRGSWVRMEYLNFEMRNPGNTLLGAPLSTVNDPRQPFIVQTVDASGNFVTVGTARVMDMSPVDLKHMQGARVSAGVPTTFGELITSFWGIETVSRFGAPELNDFNVIDLQDRATRLAQNPLAFPVNPNARLIATTLLDNGQPGTLAILYDRSFNVKYNVQTWGTDVHLAYDLRNPNDGWLLQGLIGYRYFSHAEELVQNGSFDNRSSLDDPLAPLLGIDNIFDVPVVNEIYSATRNRINSLQLGLRTEYSNRWYALGFEPKIAFGSNSVRSKVRTASLRDSPLPPLVDDGVVETRLKQSYFSPSIDLGVYARLNVTDWCAFHIGYNLMWIHNVSRADDSIYYNDLGLANPPAVVVQPTREDLWIRGLSIGGQLTWPRHR